MPEQPARAAYEDNMVELKRISADAIPHALERAERYRLLQEPELAESICLDILSADPDQPQALVSLLLALTDQFSQGLSGRLQRANDLVPRLSSEYERAYYAGIIAERSARFHLAHAKPGFSHRAFEELNEAMRCYERAESLRHAGNDDALLRWNTCARSIRSRGLKPAAVEVEKVEYPLE